MLSTVNCVLISSYFPYVFLAMVDFVPSHESSASPDNAALYSVVGIDSIKPPLSSTYGQVKSPSIQLPPIDTESFVSGRHEVNPAIALNLIQDIQRSITQWQVQQRQVISAMRTLHAQGPMVDGWLQSSLPSQPLRASSPQNSFHTEHLPNSATILRHGDADALMKYVEALDSHNADPGSLDNHSTDLFSPPSQDIATEKSQYWLCCLKDDGSVQSQLCPPEQMATVGTAIARFQKFKQLKLQQQTLEAKLQRAVDMLTDMRTAICE